MQPHFTTNLAATELTPGALPPPLPTIYFNSTTSGGTSSILPRTSSDVESVDAIIVVVIVCVVAKDDRICSSECRKNVSFVSISETGEQEDAGNFVKLPYFLCQM